MRKIIIIALLICFTGLKAQELKPFFNTLSVENGLPEGYVVSSLQDKLGYMWLGTQNGLVRYDGYELKSYPLPDENGLPLIYCSIRQIHEDKTGKLWVIVNNIGLYYFNRQKDAFIRFMLDASDENIFRDHYIAKWVEDRKSETQWFLALNGISGELGIIAFDVPKNKFEKYSQTGETGNYIPSYANIDLIQDAEGKIWVSADSLLSYFDPSSKSFKPWFVIPESEKNMIISGITPDPYDEDILWLATTNRAVSPTGNAFKVEVLQVNTKTKAYQSFEHDDKDPASIGGNCIAILNDSLERTWFSTDKGISLLNPIEGTFYNYSLNLPSIPGNEAFILAIAADKEGNLWLGGNFIGLFYLNVYTGKATYHLPGKTPGSLPDSPRGINKLFYDRSGTFWVSLPWRGISFLDQQKTTLNPIPIEPVSGGALGVISQDDFFISGRYNDSVFFVSNNSGLFTWNYKQNTYKRIELNNDNVYSRIRTVFVSEDGTIWVGTSDGLFSYFPLNKAVRSYTNDPNDSTSIPSDDANVIIEDKEGNLWIGTSDQGLCRFNRANETFTRFPFITNNGILKADNVLDDNRVLFMYFDDEGILWIGTNQGALNKFDTEKEEFTSYLDQKAGFNCVVNIFKDTQQRMWAGTYLSGLFLIDKETGSKKRYSEQNGMLFSSVFGIVEDNEGNIWTASSRGLSRLDPESNSITNFHIPIGALRSNDILFKGSDGTIQVALANGLISFNPERLTASFLPPSTVIESVSYAKNDDKDTTIYTNGSAQTELKHNENKIHFQFVALHYANSESNQYAYKLEGYDKEWIQAGTQRSATYTNLSPGSYTFNVKAGSSDGVWNENPTSLSIKILPPWWKTWWAYAAYGMILIAIIIAIDRIQRRRLIEKANRDTKEKELLQAKEIEKAYKELKATQSQLIQSEKMASLGELTAGIAHEIQNPLNFVNNFSDVSVDLMEEMDEELDAGDTAEVKVIAGVLKENLEKISHHGKRASSIVKGMLEHSRTGDGEKELSDLNALADEYLRLAYHGLRAKDKSFNADFVTDFDQDLHDINIVSQDIGRVLLNLINNAFHAVSQKSKRGIEGYKPKVFVSTKAVKQGVEVRVKDNGDGIPQHLLDKIFQPFFTTKPAGEGTGLGLSMSYDIVSKGHRGELRVETKKDEGTEFIIVLPEK